MPQAKKKPGRPTKYNPTLHPLIASLLAGNGLTDVQMADELGITEKTLNNWKNYHPKFLQSLKAGKEGPDDQVEASLFKRALGYEYETTASTSRGEIYTIVKDVPPDTLACIFWLKNRRPERWRDKTEIEHSGDVIFQTTIPDEDPPVPEPTNVKNGNGDK